MAKRVSVEIDEDLYAELVRRGGGPRKVSTVANDLIRKGLEAEQQQEAQIAAGLDTAVSRRQFQELLARIDVLEHALSEALRQQTGESESDSPSL